MPKKSNVMPKLGSSKKQTAENVSWEQKFNTLELTTVALDGQLQLAKDENRRLRKLLRKMKDGKDILWRYHLYAIRELAFPEEDCEDGLDDLLDDDEVEEHGDECSE